MVLIQEDMLSVHPQILGEERSDRPTHWAAFAPKNDDMTQRKKVNLCHPKSFAITYQLKQSTCQDITDLLQYVASKSTEVDTDIAKVSPSSRST